MPDIINLKYHHHNSRVATWMAAEEFPELKFGDVNSAKGPFDLADPDDMIDFTMLINTLNFAFTDFATGTKFEAEYNGIKYSDSEAMVACLHGAILAGKPILDGAWAADVNRDTLLDLFKGNIEIPMVDDRVSVLNSTGRKLVEMYGGKWHRFVADCSPSLYAGPDDKKGSGLLERLTTEVLTCLCLYII